MAPGYIYEKMSERSDALERLDLRLQWGPYEIHVLTFHLTSFPPGRMIAFHKHATFELHFIPRGKGKVVLVDQEFDLSPGHLYVTGPGVMHYQEADRDEAMDELCLHVDIVDRREQDKELLAAGEHDWEFAEACHCVNKLRSIPLYPAEDSFKGMPCFLEAYEACMHNYPGSYTTIKGLVIQILLRAVRAYDTVHEQKELPTKDMKAYRHHLALEFMQANYAGSISLEDVAEKLRISPRHLQRLFKELHNGNTFSRVLEDIRLTAVRRELETDTDSIEEIAGRTGFATGNYLHAVFRKRFGMTPSDYRKQANSGGR
ncbi:helix-turn-helix domain-containing protein [Paenibacillus sp. J5C_2022]|uniref:AraC family transcriptional regulator n=1 Tax=Paenibacillus sp. J5C2022 TaxID=2977129 RepID=UPI0021D3729D|nr:AraC family transcriptional regulator [Paenibacillus sp. J5C2022]MCU6710367.1 helix-turn-helix domain-containing protein [Paenibacillus sp. J5C2022]